MVDAPSGTLSFALDRANALLDKNPLLARRQAEEILRVVPGEPRAVLVLGAAHRMAGDPQGGRELLEPLAVAQPRAASVHYELGQCLAALGESDRAIAALKRATALKPDMPEAWRALGDQLTLSADAVGADAAYAQHIRASVSDPVLMQAAIALCEDRLGFAEHLLREHLKRNPTDVAALAHAGRTWHAAGPLWRRRGHAGALSRTFAELHRRAPQLCDRALSPAEVGAGDPAHRSAARRVAGATPAIAT